MADKKIADLPIMTAPEQQPTDIMERSDAAGTVGQSKQESRALYASWVVTNAIIYGNGIKLTAPNTVSVDLNVTNLKFTANLLNTIQDIATTSSPTFNELDLTGRLKALTGYQSFSQQLILGATPQAVDATVIGKTIVNDPTLPQVLNLTLNDGLVNGSQFDMIREGTGSFGVQAAVGVTINGIDGDLFEIQNQFSKVNWSKIKNNTWVVNGFLGSEELSDNLGEMYFFGGNTPTTFAGAATPVIVAGTYVAVKLDNFTEVNGELIWGGSVPATFKVTALIGGTPDLTTDTFTAFVALNGTAIDKSQMPIYFGPTTPAVNPIPVQAIVDLSPGDAISVQIQNDFDTNPFEAKVLNCIVSQSAGSSTVPPPPVSNASSGNSGLGFVSQVGATGTVIDSQLFEKIDNITNYNAGLSFTPTTNTVLITLSTSADNNLVDISGSGNLSVISLNSKISASSVEPLAIVKTPNSTYSPGDWEPIVLVFNGSKTIPANTLKEGDQIAYCAQGRIISSGGGGNGEMRVLFGGSQIAITPVMSSNQNFQKSFDINFVGTMQDAATMRFSAVGGRVRSGDDTDGIDLPITSVFAFNPALAQVIDIEYRLNSNPGIYTFIADTASIVKTNSITNGVYSSSEVRTLGIVPATKNLTVAFTVSNANLNKPHNLNLSLSYED